MARCRIMENSVLNRMRVNRGDLIKSCKAYLDKKIRIVKDSLAGLKEDLENESKSSAGDKYETGREMINIEWNKLTTQLNEYDRLEQILNRIEKNEFHDTVILGSIVMTSNANYFISIPAGEIMANGKKFYAVGIQSPVARQLIGKKRNDSFNISGKSCKIEEII